MADRYIPFPVVQESVRNVPFAQTVTVTEKRAPTDESIKLYGEMLDKARSELIETINIKSSVVGEIVVGIFRNFSPDHFGIPLVARYRFILNGETYIGEIIVQEDTYQKADFNDVVSEAVFHKFVTEVAAKLFHKHINTAIAERHRLT